MGQMLISLAISVELVTFPNYASDVYYGVGICFSCRIIITDQLTIEQTKIERGVINKM